LQDKTQTFVTTSKESFVENFGGGARVFTVSNGNALINKPLLTID
jgi:recombinational DNA repair ATPase RecF